MLVSSQPRVLMLDDNPRIRAMLARYLEEQGLVVSSAANGAEMRERLGQDQVDLVLLDLVMPGEDGFALAREIRSMSDIGIIFVTGRSDMVDAVVGLELGADDYITKPFHLREVLARTKSVLRRLQPRPEPAQADPWNREEQRLSFEGWRLFVDRRQLTSPEGSDTVLTTSEFNLLLTFLKNAGRVLTRDALMDLTHGREWEAFDRAIDVLVARLRRKIEPDPKNPTFIKSVRGVGYVFAVRVLQS